MNKGLLNIFVSSKPGRCSLQCIENIERCIERGLGMRMALSSHSYESYGYSQASQPVDLSARDQ